VTLFFFFFSGAGSGNSTDNDVCTAFQAMNVLEWIENQKKSCRLCKETDLGKMKMKIKIETKKPGVGISK
jgi:hypothetical protein